MLLRVLLAIPCALAMAEAQSDLAAGAARFRLYCSECHGLKGYGGRGPDLVSGRWTHGGADADLARTIARGVPGAAMPGFGGQFSESDIQELVVFIRSLASGGEVLKVTGDAARGREIYWGKAGCAQCHMVAGRGGRLGPELTRIGAQRSIISLKDSIVAPSKDIAEGFQAVRVVPRGGRPVIGIRRNQDNFTIQVFDTAEKYHSFRKADLDTLEESPDSLMPPSPLTASEIDDLIAYLDSLRGKP